jgi:hypothetical protein
MNHFLLRLFLVFAIVFSIDQGIQAQRTAFIYLQSEEGVPFYLKRNNQIYNSTASGYLILGKLPENDLLFHIGFPGGSTPEQLFRLPVTNGGKGFLIKSFGEKGWGLFDFQDASIIYAMEVETNSGTKTVIKNDQPVNDAFANMLSAVTRDTTVKYVGVQPKKTDPVVSIQIDSTLTKSISVDSSASLDMKVTDFNSAQSTDSTTLVQEVKDSTISSVDVSSKTVFPKSGIAIESNEKVAEGTNVVFIIGTQQSASDTVRGFIPAEVVVVDSAAVLTDPILDINIAARDSMPVADTTVRDISLIQNKLNVADSTSFVVNGNQEPPVIMPDSSLVVQHMKDSSLNISKQTAESLMQKMNTLPLKDSGIVLSQITTEEVQEKKIQHADSPVKKEDDKSGSVSLTGSYSAINTICKKAATDEDFLKARRKMAQQSKDEEMVAEVQKFFKNMCFTTEQIRNLAALFLSEEGRYRFYDASMKYVLDFQNFHTLENTMLTPYYKKRFQALIPE